MILTGGRHEYLEVTISSLKKHLKSKVSEKIIFDNSDGPDIIYDGYKTIKVESFGLPYGSQRHARVIQFIFDYINNSDIDYIFFVEEDFELLQDIYLEDIYPHLTDEYSQIRLSRNYKFKTLQKISDDVYFSAGDPSDQIESFLFSWHPSVFERKLALNKYPLDVMDHEFEFGNKLNKKFLVYKYPQQLIKHIGINSLEKGTSWPLDHPVIG